MTQTIYLSGTAYWAKLKVPDSKYNYYGLDLYLDEESWPKFKESGMTSEIREGELDGQKANYIRVRRDTQKLIKKELVTFGPPDFITAENEKYAEGTEPDVGNGSKVTCKISVYDTMKGRGSRLEAVRIDELVEYKANDVNDGPF